jgi:hypothetical protein
MRNRFRWELKATLLVTALVGSLSCSDSTSPDIDDISDFFASLTTANTQVSASLRSGDPPAAGSGPTAEVTGTSAMILGGSAQRTVTSTEPFNRVLVSVAGFPGYLELTLPNSVTSQDVILTLAQNLAESVFIVNIAAAAGTSVGTADTEPVSIVTVGTGPVQVSVSWNTESDVDLHLVEPGEEEIYYGNRESESGAILDLDSNAGCAIDGTRNENIFWPTDSPPRGTYTIRVDNWDACEVTGTTTFVVTVRVTGRSPVTFTGQLTGPGDQGGQGDGVLVGTFVY